MGRPVYAMLWANSFFAVDNKPTKKRVIGLNGSWVKVIDMDKKIPTNHFAEYTDN